LNELKQRSEKKSRHDSPSSRSFRGQFSPDTIAPFGDIPLTCNYHDLLIQCEDVAMFDALSGENSIIILIIIDYY
jgi:hypothetical protein